MRVEERLAADWTRASKRDFCLDVVFIVVHKIAIFADKT